MKLLFIVCRYCGLTGSVKLVVDQIPIIYAAPDIFLGKCGPVPLTGCYTQKQGNQLRGREWQKSLKWWILCVKRDGFELYIQDETMLLQDHVPKRGP